VNVEWTRPVGFWALALPALLVLLSLRRAKPNPLHLGTLRLWRDLAGEGDGARIRWRLPLSRVLLVAGLSAGALALAGPRPGEPDQQSTWHVIVDTRPAMFLEHTTEGGLASGRGTRLAVALGTLDQLLHAQATRPKLLWSRRLSGVTRLDRLAADQVPDDFLVAAPGGYERRSWSALDEPNTLWLSDRLPPGPAPQYAGYVLSGGGPVAGAVASVGDRSLVLSGGQIVEGRALARRAVYVDPGVPKRLALFARIWSEQRGFDVLDVDTGADRLALRLLATAIAEPSAVPCTFGRDGWQARAQVSELRDDPSPEARWSTWLSGQVNGREQRLVTWQPGRVRLAFREPFEESSVDPGTFAVSWAELLDRALAPAPGILTSAERASAGDTSSRAPQPGIADPRAAPAAWPLERLLAAAAAVLLFAAALIPR